MNPSQTPRRKRRSDPRTATREPELFSESRFWQWQTRFYSERGPTAWQTGEVPHQVSNSRLLAATYAELVLANWRDQQRLGIGAVDEPLYILEIGGGSGRFAYHFLTELARRCGELGVGLDRFRYVLSDAVASNIEAWLRHPLFRTWFESGLLETAHFDLCAPTPPRLMFANTSLAQRKLTRPIVLIANYVLDTIPQDLFWVEDGKPWPIFVKLEGVGGNPDRQAAALLKDMRTVYEKGRPKLRPRYAEPWLETMLAEYCRSLDRRCFQMPAVGLRAIHHLTELSASGALLLIGDKGETRLEDIGRPAPPSLVHHGSVSLDVNFHAYAAFAQSRGGCALFPARRADIFTIGCFLISDRAAQCTETTATFARHVADYGPDDFYTLSRGTWRVAPQLAIREILSLVRLSRHDGYFFTGFVVRLVELAPNSTRREREAILDTIEKLWAGYFPIGERTDVALAIACLTHALRDPQRTRRFLAESVAAYGESEDTRALRDACEELEAEIRTRDIARESAGPARKQTVG